MRATERRGCGLHGASRARFGSRRPCGDAVGWEVAGHRGEGGAKGRQGGCSGRGAPMNDASPCTFVSCYTWANPKHAHHREWTLVEAAGINGDNEPSRFLHGGDRGPAAWDAGGERPRP